MLHRRTVLAALAATAATPALAQSQAGRNPGVGANGAEMKSLQNPGPVTRCHSRSRPVCWIRAR